jgi:hypothetical protein
VLSFSDRTTANPYPPSSSPAQLRTTTSPTRSDLTGVALAPLQPPGGLRATSGAAAMVLFSAARGFVFHLRCRSSWPVLARAGVFSEHSHWARRFPLSKKGEQ